MHVSLSNLMYVTCTMYGSLAVRRKFAISTVAVRFKYGVGTVLLRCGTLSGTVC